MQRRDARARVAPQHREMQVIAVEVDHVEPRDIAEDHLQQAEVVRERLAAFRIAARAREGSPRPAWPRSGNHRWRTA